MLIVTSCHKAMLTNQVVQEKEIKKLTEQLIYGKEEEVRIKALNDLTRMGIKVRYNAVDELLSAAESNPELFPRENYEKNQSLLKGLIKAEYLNENKAKNGKEYVKVRTMHLQILNRMVVFSIRNRMYYETAKIFYQKYLYGTLWSKESLNIYKNRSAATEFDNARNAGVAYLQFLSEIVRDERTKNLIIKYLEQIDQFNNLSHHSRESNEMEQ
jgi:hypothetical protein